MDLKKRFYRRFRAAYRVLRTIKLPLSNGAAVTVTILRCVWKIEEQIKEKHVDFEIV